MTKHTDFDAAALANELFDALAAATGDGIGITRECYADGENTALEIFSNAAKAAGLTIEADPLANLVVRLPDDDGLSPALYIGSHADSVPQGGNFDGAAGIVAGLICLIRILRSGRSLSVPVRVIMLRGEESAFYGRANIGSRALFGLIGEDDLLARSRGTGKMLQDAMAELGIDVAGVRARKTFFPPEAALGYLELHIEQGPVMVARELPAAVVSGIRGNLRHRRVVCRGEAGHSGAIPRWLRHDPVFAFADLVSRLDDHWQTLLERGTDLVVTCGIVGTDPSDHAISRIPGSLAFSFEVRSQSQETLDDFYAVFQDECSKVAELRRVSFEFDPVVLAEPARMAPEMIGALEAAARNLEIPFDVLPSGAGHDAAVFANAGIASGMVFVRNRNGSHNPHEAMEIDDFLKGVDILHAAVTAGN
ncbi:MAG: hydantoinase/carbamoylase family amidase [Devosia sp.]